MIQEFNTWYDLSLFECHLSYWTCSSFRLIPTFGKDMIHRFTSNILELSKLAVWDFEDILQVCWFFESWIKFHKLSYSVWYLFLMVYFQNCITPSFLTFFLNWWHVMVQGSDLIFSIIHLLPLTVDSPLMFTISVRFFLNIYRYEV